MSDRDRSEQLLGDARERLETAATLVDLVQYVNGEPILRDADDERFTTLTYDAVPIVRALLCRKLAGFSWNGLYEYLSTDAYSIGLRSREVREVQHRSDTSNTDAGVG